MKRVVASLLLCLAHPTWAQDPAFLQLKVVQGEGAVYAAGTRATRGVIVQITDPTGQPVEGATVSFRLPAQGPTGVFSSGDRVDTVASDAEGNAEAWGMQWGREPGAFELRVTAAKGAARGGTLVPLHLSDAAVLTGSTPQISDQPGGGRKKLWIALGLAGAATAAVIGVAGAKPPGTVNPPAVIGGPQIGTPTIVIGRP